MCFVINAASGLSRSFNIDLFLYQFCYKVKSLGHTRDSLGLEKCPWFKYNIIFF